MTKVSITVAAHAVEIEADAALSEVAFAAMRLYRESTLPANSLAVGFGTTAPAVERAEPYIEPQPEESHDHH